jgi:starch phosphorylase
MEIGFDPKIPTYSGGLGILAGDTLKACADLKVPIIGITLISEKGYFTQTLNPQDGSQIENPTIWEKSLLQKLPARVTVQIEGRTVAIQAWQYLINGITGFDVPVILLDTDVPENTEEDRTITSFLYGGDQRYRLMQEVVLGIGGVRMLKALGYTTIARHHMNEGHASLLALELFKEQALTEGCTAETFKDHYGPIVDNVRKFCVFTTHTPVAAGHDQFPYDLVMRILDGYVPIECIKHFGGEEKLNMTLLALNLSHYVNSVARRHMDISKLMFPGYHISFVTNGVHSATWTSPEFAKLFDKHLPGWHYDSFELRHALNIPKHEIWEAHMAAKRVLVQHINSTTNAGFAEDVFTIGFARRATAYKRADLLFYDIPRLREIAKTRKIQVVFGGKAHPKDTQGKDLIKKIRWHMGEMADMMKVVYLPNYDFSLARILIPGVDLWLNTPARPQEASGTSGMKAAHNGVPSFSVLDGWWLEGHNEGVTGWSIGPYPAEDRTHDDDDVEDSTELYTKLQNVILPLFYDDNDHYRAVMRNTIAFNASFFNTHRMVQQYALKAYLR